MQHPLQAILIAGEIARDDIIRGHKTTTIRNGFRAYRKGEVVMIGCHILNWCVMKTIIDVQHVLLNNEPTTVQLYKKNGYGSFGDAYNELKKYYPDLQVDGPVTFVEWM